MTTAEKLQQKIEIEAKKYEIERYKNESNMDYYGVSISYIDGSNLLSPMMLELVDALKNIYADGSHKDIASEFSNEALNKFEKWLEE